MDALDHLVSQEAALRAELEETTQRLEETTREMATMRNHWASPVKGAATYDLPVEILTQIFLSLHATQTLTRNHAARNPGFEIPPNWNPEIMGMLPVKFNSWPRVEVVLSWVCRRWRNIALSLPSLWSVFWTRPETATCEGLITEIRRLRTYLKRSRTHLLELYMEFQAPAFLPSNADTMFWRLMKEMLYVTVKYARRWKCFTFSAVNHDKRMLGSLVIPFQRKMARMVAPNLQKFVVRISPSAFTGSRIMPGLGWEAQVIHGPNHQHRPPLKYVKLDRAALPFFRPYIGRVAHLVFEYGVRSDTPSQPTFQMDWPVFITEVLRSPYLESLSVSDELLRATTFPGSPWDWAGLRVDMQRIKHLRLGRRHERSERHSALYFLLRYITAPRLESLTLAGYIMEECPWGLAGREEWLTQWETVSGSRALEVFPSLKSLYLVDLTIPSKAVRKVAGAIIRLADITTFARRLLVSESLKPLFGQTSPFLTLPVVRFWPLAEEVTLNYEIGYAFYHWSKAQLLTFLTPWQSMRVLRLPPTQIALWLGAIDQGRHGNLRRRGKDIVFSGVASRTGPFIVKPIEEFVPRYWPPDADVAPSNTLEFEGNALPFHHDIVEIDECVAPWT